MYRDGVAVGLYGFLKRDAVGSGAAVGGVSVLDLLHDGDSSRCTGNAVFQSDFVMELSGNPGEGSSPVGPGHHECSGVYFDGMAAGLCL